jgi:osmotically inducible lipoprotein OsmB
MRHLWKTTAALALLCVMAACGDTVGEQALLGAGAGAGTAAVFDGNVLGGAALGAGANILYCQENPGEC